MKYLSRISLLLLLLIPQGGAIALVPPPVKIEGAWLRAVPTSSDDSAVYLTVTNTGDQPLQLTGGEMEIASMVMPMITTKKIVAGSEVLGMESVPAFDIPAHGKLVLEPGGSHLMIMGLKKHPAPGDRVKLILKFNSGSLEVPLEIPVSMEPVKQ